MTAVALVDHFIVSPPWSDTLTAACGAVVLATPIPPDGAPRCSQCEGLVESGAVA